MARIKREILKLIRIVLALVLMLLGIVLFPLPIPLGALFLVIGFCWLLLESSRMRQWTTERRAAWPWFNKLFEKMEPYLPGKLKVIDHSTRPNGKSGKKSPKKN